ncbi:MAG: hypothetical protein CL401_08140 [Acidiferrobacteraceae bacterium]|nr:hypothetical protein [Acidiferrobacteraceae bacterium]|tara:strand:- start:167 stop:397 length:231 start_codon:yes stop_codon:yes gene_type:complete
MSDKALYKQIIKTLLIDGLVDGRLSPPNTRVIHDSDDDSDDDSYGTLDIDLDGLVALIRIEVMTRDEYSEEKDVHH